MRYTFVLFEHLLKLNVKLLCNFWSKTYTLQFMTAHISVFPNKRHDIFGDSNIRLTLWDQSRGCGNNVHYSELTSMRQFTPDFRHSHRELMYEVYSWEIVAQIQTCLAWLFWIEQFHDIYVLFIFETILLFDLKQYEYNTENILAFIYCIRFKNKIKYKFSKHRKHDNTQL